MTAEVMQWVWFGAALVGWAFAWRLDGLLADALDGWQRASDHWRKTLDVLEAHYKGKK
jgi:hypothetical protein